MCVPLKGTDLGIMAVSCVKKGCAAICSRVGLLQSVMMSGGRMGVGVSDTVPKYVNIEYV